MLKVKIDGQVLNITKEQYIEARTLDLQRLGYNKLTEQEFANILNAVLQGEKLQDVIAVFIERDNPVLL